jgi:hypothetical protein
MQCEKKPSHATVPLSPAMPSATLPYSLAGTLSRSPDPIKVNIYGPDMLDHALL